MRKAATALIACTAIAVQAINPIVPPGMFMADPSGHVWQDGKLYVYGSRDESPKYYCSTRYDVLSTSDLENWTIHRDAFASKGKGDEVGYSDAILAAPDCHYKDGKYYMFYCLDIPTDNEGVAVGNTPYGPFKGGVKIEGANQIDPAVFTDDDGTSYLYWGQFTAKVAKLNPDMKSLDMKSYRDSIITEDEHHFHEGIQMIKINGLYYLVYAHIGRHGMATSIGYSVGKTPYGPFKYGGVIVDNFGCDPNVWNNHGSIVKFNGKWYVMYHRATHGCVTMRKACIEPITINPDGSINEVEMTTQGASAPLNPFERMDAARACQLTGTVRVELESPSNEWLTKISNLNTAAYKYFDFNRSPKKISMRITPGAGGKIIVFANNLCRPVLATIDVPKGNGKDAITITESISGTINGIHPIYFRFIGKEGCDNLYNIDWFEFK